MQLEAKKYLHDVQQAAARIAEFTAGKQFEDCQRARCCMRPPSANSRSSVKHGHSWPPIVHGNESALCSNQLRGASVSLRKWLRVCFYG
jgi:hypothetical protein